MICKYITMQSREFLQAGDALIPIDSIREINIYPNRPKFPLRDDDSGVLLNVEKENILYITTAYDKYFWRDEDADDLRKFLNVKLSEYEV